MRRSVTGMRIGYVTSELYPWKTGGPQNVVHNLANRLAGEVDLVMLYVSPETGFHPREHYREEIEFHAVRDRGPAWLRYPARNLDYSRATAALESCDVVHFHILPGANCFFLPARLRRKGRSKLLLSFYDWVPSELAFYGFQEKMRHILHWEAAKRRLKLFDLYIVNSTFMRDIVASRGFKPVVVIPNGIDPGKWKVDERPETAGAVSALFWGRLYDKKGVGELIKAVSMLPECRDRFHLYIAGDGPGMNRYLSRCRSLGLEEMITFPGALPGKELRRYLAMSDFCVFPSVYEGFGISILESMAAGKPVITSRRGGQTDFARDGYNSLLADPGNPAELARAIREMVENPVLRARLGENAAATAATYAWDAIVKDYLDLYARVMRGG